MLLLVFLLLHNSVTILFGIITRKIKHLNLLRVVGLLKVMILNMNKILRIEISQVSNPSLLGELL